MRKAIMFIVGTCLLAVVPLEVRGESEESEFDGVLVFENDGGDDEAAVGYRVAEASEERADKVADYLDAESSDLGECATEAHDADEAEVSATLRVAITSEGQVDGVETGDDAGGDKIVACFVDTLEEATFSAAESKAHLEIELEETTNDGKAAKSEGASSQGCGDTAAGNRSRAGGTRCAVHGDGGGVVLNVKVTNVDGALDEEVAQRVLMHRRKSLQNCNEPPARDGQKVTTGELSFTLTINNEDGGVDKVVVEEESLGSDEVVGCMEKKLMHVRFPRPDEGDVDVEYRVAFEKW